MNTTIKLLCSALALSFAACGDDSPTKQPDASQPPDGSNSTPTPKWVQVEQLARPGINEALLINNAFLNGYNATAPTFAGVDSTTLGAVVGEAKTVLKAVYLGTCLLDGALSLTPQSGLHPAGMECHAVGPAIWTENSLATGKTLTQASQTAAAAYADKVFGLFEPDVMRIDTSAASGYLTLCGGTTAGAPLLCGGRNLTDDVIDITYNFLIAGAAVGKGNYDQVHALVSDGVQYDLDSDTPNVGSSINNPVATRNPAQGHPAVSSTFPYSAAPF